MKSAYEREFTSNISSFYVSDQPFGTPVSILRSGEPAYLNFSVSRTKTCMIKFSIDLHYFVDHNFSKFAIFNVLQGSRIVEEGDRNISEAVMIPNWIPEGNYKVIRTAIYSCSGSNSSITSLKDFDIKIVKGK